jgi:hypothetical protein
MADEKRVALVDVDARARQAGQVLAACLGIALGGCRSLTDVSAPDVVQVSGLDNPAGADALRAGALNSFAVVYAGNPAPSQVIASGLIADEFGAATGRTATAIITADQRLLVDPTESYPYIAMHRARLAARRAADALRLYSPGSASRVAEMLALAAYTEVFLAENLCAGVPLGKVDGDRLVYGQPLTTAELLEHSIAAFDSAIALAPQGDRSKNLAVIGRARAVLDLGRFSDAAQTVVGVPTSFTYSAEYAATVQPNGVFDIINNLRQVTVSNREGRNGLDFRSAADPRVPTQLAGKSADGIDVFGFTRYSSVASAVPLATGVEARLIEAEASLRAGDATRALATLNALRTTVPGLAPLLAEATEAGSVDQLFRERAFWLFATGHRHGDLRRLVRQYGRSAESVFPTGTFPLSGLAYGTDVTFTPDVAQALSPAYTGCAGRAP